MAKEVFQLTTDLFRSYGPNEPDPTLPGYATDVELAAEVATLEAADTALSADIAALTHNDSLGGLDGGTAGEYFHLTAAEYAGLVTNPLTIENRTDDPGSPAVGQVWFRTDL